VLRVLLSISLSLSLSRTNLHNALDMACLQTLHFRPVGEGVFHPPGQAPALLGLGKAPIGAPRVWFPDLGHVPYNLNKKNMTHMTNLKHKKTAQLHK
jgi:hypothetical protein